jgi:hypothetical protein
MPDRVTGVLLLFYGIAAASFAVGLYALAHGVDLMAVLLLAFGALSLRALSQSSRVGDGGTR